VRPPCPVEALEAERVWRRKEARRCQKLRTDRARGAAGLGLEAGPDGTGGGGSMPARLHRGWLAAWSTAITQSLDMTIYILKFMLKHASFSQTTAPVTAAAR